MHDALYESQGALGREDLIHHATGLGLDVERFTEELDSESHAPRVQRDVDSGLASGVSGTPGFFVGGRLFGGSFDAASLTTALETAAGRPPSTGSRPDRPPGQRRPRRARGATRQAGRPARRRSAWMTVPSSRRCSPVTETVFRLSRRTGVESGAER